MSDDGFVGEHSENEVMAVLISRLLDDGDRITAGAHTEMCFAGCMLAQQTHAPNLKLQLGGTCYLCNTVEQEIDELPHVSTQYNISQWAEEVHDHHETFHFYNAPGEGNSYEETNKFYFADKFFVSGFQADKQGNVNLIGIGDGRDYTVRGPGSIGINDVLSVQDIIIFLTSHDERTLVEETDYVSSLGPNGYDEYGFPGNGPQCILTPKAVFDFTDDGLARLRGVMSNTTVDEVLDSTGFEPEMPDEVEIVDPPSDGEIEHLRSAIDPTGVLQD